jgi:hypothetical protein
MTWLQKLRLLKQLMIGVQRVDVSSGDAGVVVQAQVS